MLLVVSYRNSLITEDFNKVKSLKAELATLQKENQQTQVSIESNLNLSKIEEEAKVNWECKNLQMIKRYI